MTGLGGILGKRGDFADEAPTNKVTRTTEPDITIVVEIKCPKCLGTSFDDIQAVDPETGEPMPPDSAPEHTDFGVYKFTSCTLCHGASTVPESIAAAWLKDHPEKKP